MRASPSGRLLARQDPEPAAAAPAHTLTGTLFPTDDRATAAAWIGAAITALAPGISVTLRPHARAAATGAPLIRSTDGPALKAKQ